MKNKKGHIDWLLLLPVVLLMMLSLAFVYSASATYSEVNFGGESALFWNHSFRVFLSFLAIILFASIDYHNWQKLSRMIIITSVLLLIIVLAFGMASKGATRWLNLGFITVQPSEIAKFAMVVHFAALIVDKQDRIKDFKTGFMPFMVWLGGICILIAMQPNFSTMMLIFLIGMLMIFIGNAHILHIFATGAVGGLLAGIYAVSAEYRMDRILAFFDTSKTDPASAYQLNQSLIALGNGGFTGMGAGQSRQSLLYLPESYGDFILAIIGEEYGFIGLFVLLLLFGIIFWRGFVIAKNSPDNFGFYLAIGIVLTFAVYVFINAGVNTGLLPTTGVPIPFLSYGGTAILINASAIGVLLNISAQAGVYPIEEEGYSESERAQ
jgi:cell division protein FtsW